MAVGKQFQYSANGVYFCRSTLVFDYLCLSLQPLSFPVRPCLGLSLPVLVCQNFTVGREPLLSYFIRNRTSNTEIGQAKTNVFTGSY